LRCFNLERRASNLYFAYLGKKTEEPFYIISPDTNYILFLTDIEGHRARSILKSFIKNSKPFLDFPILVQDDLFSLLDNLSQDYEEIKFLEGTLKSEGETQRKWKHKDTIYNKSELEEISDREDARWSSIAVVCHNEVNLKFRIYDDGWMTFYYGSFSKFFHDVTRPLLRTISNRRKVFKSIESKASEVDFDVIRFESKERLEIPQIKSLKNALSRKYISSVIHEGNPFFQLDLIDNEDYSSMTLYAYKNIIEIVPGRKVTSAALIELTTTILNTLPTLTLL